MNKSSKIYGPLLAVILISMVAATQSSATTYAIDNTSGTCVSSRTITATDSGMASNDYSVRIYNSSGQRVPLSSYTAGIDTSEDSHRLMQLDRSETSIGRGLIPRVRQRRPHLGSRQARYRYVGTT
jgi:predicted porin